MFLKGKNSIHKNASCDLLQDLFNNINLIKKWGIYRGHTKHGKKPSYGQTE
jgi:hypothetical protein